MTLRQYTRWKDFAQRMAARGWENITPARQQKLRRYVDAYFADLEYTGDWQAMKSWDTNVDAFWRVDFPGESLLKPVKAMYACDQYSEFSQNLPGYWQMSDARVWNDTWKFERQISCCLRAGMDMASSPSAGVLGFRVADLRRMYPEGIPAWLNTFTTRDGQPVDLDALPAGEGVWL